MEEFRSYVEECEKTKALLPAWCDHRVKVEAGLRGLARQLGDWEVETITAAINSMVARGTEAADGAMSQSSVSLRLPKSGQRRIQRRRGRRFLRNPGTKGATSFELAVNSGARNTESAGRMFESPSSRALRNCIGNTVALLEQDKILTENLAGAIENLIEKESFFLRKIFGGLNEHDFFLPPETSANALIDVQAVVWRLSRQNVSMQKFLCDMLGILMDLNWSLHLTEAVRDIANLALEGSQYRGEVSLQLRTFADKAGQCQSVCRLIMEYLELQ